MKTKSWCSIALTLSCVFAAAVANAEVVVELPRMGSYAAWVTAPPDGDPVAGPTLVEDANKTILETGKVKNTGKWTLHVVDTSKGNAARVPVPAGETPRVTLRGDSFDRIARVVVTVTDKEGKTPSYADVTLTDGKGQDQRLLLEPADKGLAVFRDVASGEGKVRVQQGSAANQQTITVPLRLERDAPVLSLTADVSLPDGMKTTAAAAGTAASGKETPSAGLGNNFLGVLIGFMLLAIILYAVWRSMRSRGMTAEKILNQVGVQLPEDGTSATPVVPAPEAVSDPNQCPFCGQQKDPVTGACACTLGARPAGSIAPLSGAGERRLVAVAGSRAGSIFPVTGPTTIGRDPGQDIALTDDSALSRRHATLQPENGGVIVVDNGSSNGTFVNGRKVDRQRLQAGDELTVGSSRFRFEE